MFFKKVLLPIIILEFAILIFVSICYGFMVYTWNAIWPEWSINLIPILLSLLFLFLLKDKIFGILLPDNEDGKSIRRLMFILFLFIPILSAVLFSPISQSLRYNLGKVLTINSINDLKRYETPAFVQVNDWYVDRMRVIPLKTVSKASYLGMGKHTVNLLLIVPIFSNDQAYRSYARAFLAFEYEEEFTGEELREGKDEAFINGSLTHFKRMNIRDFRYLEAYPRNEKHTAFIRMAQIHNYFESGFGNVYKGQEVDRDILSAHFLKYFLFLFVVLGIPILLLLSGIIWKVLWKTS